MVLMLQNIIGYKNIRIQKFEGYSCLCSFLDQISFLDDSIHNVEFWIETNHDVCYSWFLKVKPPPFPYAK